MIVVYIGSIDEAKQFAYQTVDTTLVLRNWYIARIVNEARSQLGVLSWTHYRILTQQLENGTKKKLMSKYGVQQPCKEIKNPVIAEFLGILQYLVQYRE